MPNTMKKAKRIFNYLGEIVHHSFDVFILNRRQVLPLLFVHVYKQQNPVSVREITNAFRFNFRVGMKSVPYFSSSATNVSNG